MTTLIIVIILIASVLLVLAVMSQSAKGSGLAAGIGSAAASQLMGAKRTTDFLEKSTWGFVGVILLFSLMANVLMERPQAVETSPNIEAAKKKQVAQPKQPTGLDSLAQTAQDTTKVQPKTDTAK
jgi:preprotein translocase subunit SecG